MDIHQIYCNNHLMMHISQIIMSCTYPMLWYQLHINKSERKIKQNPAKEAYNRQNKQIIQQVVKDFLDL